MEHNARGQQTAIGRMIVFEGPDGVGKSTLAKALTEHIAAAHQPCNYVAFPGREPGTLGKHVYDLHHNAAQFGVQAIHPLSLQMMHVAAHIDAIEGHITSVLKAGRWVILDRFWWSTLMYGLVDGIPHSELQLLIDIEKRYWRRLQPTIVFLVQTVAPLRTDEPLERWRTLSNNYKEHALNQRQFHPVHILLNDGSIKEGLDQILAALKNASPGQKLPFDTTV